MPSHWTVRWLAMIALFAVTTFAFASYARADIEASSIDAAETTAADQRADNGEVDDQAPPPDVEIERPPHFMTIILRSALLGTAVGALVGASVYVLSQRRFTPWVIGYSAAGGVLFGTLVGIFEIGMREAYHRRSSTPDASFRSPAGVDGIDSSAPTPESHGLFVPLFQLRF